MWLIILNFHTVKAIQKCVSIQGMVLSNDFEFKLIRRDHFYLFGMRYTLALRSTNFSKLRVVERYTSRQQ